jgi:hypothetical protein
MVVYRNLLFVLDEKRRRFLDDQLAEVGLDGDLHPLTKVMLVPGDQIVGTRKYCGGQDRCILRGEDDAEGQKRSRDIGNKKGLFQQASETGGMDRADAIPLGLIDGIRRGHRCQVAHFPELKEPIFWPQ